MIRSTMLLKKCLSNYRLSTSDVTFFVTSNGKNTEANNSLKRSDKAYFPKSLWLDSLMSNRAHALCKEFSPDRGIHNLFLVLILWFPMKAAAWVQPLPFYGDTGRIRSTTTRPLKSAQKRVNFCEFPRLSGQIRLEFGT